MKNLEIWLSIGITRTKELLSLKIKQQYQIETKTLSDK